jgi:hypothetical protein
MSTCFLCRNPLCQLREKSWQHYHFVSTASATCVPLGTAIPFPGGLPGSLERAHVLYNGLTRVFS